jgi:hypothetical protein
MANQLGRLRVRALRFVAHAIGIIVLAGCNGSTDPEQFTGTYELVFVNDSSLPYEYSRRVTAGGIITLNVYDGRLEFRTRNRVFDIRTLDFIQFGPDTLVTAYRIEGEMLLLFRAATPGNAGYTDTGIVDNDIITVRQRHLPGKPDINAVFVYTLATP